MPGSSAAYVSSRTLMVVRIHQASDTLCRRVFDRSFCQVRAEVVSRAAEEARKIRDSKLMMIS